MKQTLQLKLSQHLTLTPQLQQSIRLLQLSTIELNAEVERMLQENPLLERAEGEDEPLPIEVPLSGPGRVGDERDSVTRTSGEGGDSDDETRGARNEGPDSDDYRDYDGGADGDWGARSGSDDEDFLPQQIASNTLRDHLLGQLALLNLPLRDR